MRHYIWIMCARSKFCQREDVIWRKTNLVRLRESHKDSLPIFDIARQYLFELTVHLSIGCQRTVVSISTILDQPNYMMCLLYKRYRDTYSHTCQIRISPCSEDRSFAGWLIYNILSTNNISCKVICEYLFEPAG